MSAHHPTRIHVKCTYSSFQKRFRMYLKYKVHTFDIKMCPLTEGVPETKAGCSVWLVYKFGQRGLVKRLYVSAKLIKQTNCCEKLSDLPSFPSCKLHIISNRFRWDRSIRITPNSTSSVSVAPTLVSTGGSQVAQWVTRSPLLRLVPYCGPPSSTHHHQHSFFLRRKFFCGLDGAGDAPTPP